MQKKNKIKYQQNNKKKSTDYIVHSVLSPQFTVNLFNVQGAPPPLTEARPSDLWGRAGSTTTSATAASGAGV